MILRISKILAASLEKQLSSQRIGAMFSRLPPAAPAAATEEVCVCALQMELKTYPSVSAWIRSLDAVLAQAAGQGCSLVCLPEFYAMTPLLCHWAAALAAKGSSLLPADSGGSGGDLKAAPLLEIFAFLTPAYEDIICRFARRYGIYLYGGTGLVWEAGRVFNRGFLATPAGNVAARQDKIHLTAEEIAMGISPGSNMQVISTPIGNIALSVCMDATYFETFRVAKALGADHIIVPIGDMAEFDPWLALRGAQMRVDETGLAAIKPALVSGPGIPVTFSGKAGIYFPRSTGMASVEHPCPSGGGMVISRFSLSCLREAESELFLRKNPKFDQNYCKELIKTAGSRKINNQ